MKHEYIMQKESRLLLELISHTETEEPTMKQRILGTGSRWPAIHLLRTHGQTECDTRGP